MKKTIVLTMILFIFGIGVFSFVRDRSLDVYPGFGSGFITSKTEFNGNIIFTLEEIFTDAYDGLRVKISGRGFHGKLDDPYPLICVDEEGNPLWKGFGFDIQFDGEKMLLDVGKGMSPKVCDQVNPPRAKRFSYVFDVDQENFTFEVRSDGRVDIYEIELEEEMITVVPINSSFTEFESMRIVRVPKNIIYASCYRERQKWFYPQDKRCVQFYKDIEEIAIPYELKGDVVDNYYIYSGSDQTIHDIYLKYRNEEGLAMSVSTKDGRWASRNSSHDSPLRVSPVFNPYNPRYEPNRIEIDLKNINLSECNDDESCLLEVAYNTQDALVCKLLSDDARGECYHMMAILKLDEKFCGYNELSAFERSECRYGVANLIRENR